MRVVSCAILLMMAVVSHTKKPQHQSFPNPLLHPSNTPIPGEYIIVFNEQILKSLIKVRVFIDQLEEDYPITTTRQYVCIFAIHVETDLDEKTLQQIEDLKEVKYIEQNKMAYGHYEDTECPAIPSPRTWALDRIDQRTALSDQSTDPEDSTYGYDPTIAAVETTVYVLDTGIEINHPEFEGRASWGFTSDGLSEGDFDASGHGTHCAGIIGSSCFGVSKKTKLVAVKVLDSNSRGPWSGVAGGLDWVLSTFKTQMMNEEYWPHAVISMSLGGPTSKFVNAYIEACLGEGITVVVSAGNNKQDGCLSTPTSVPGTIRVAATQSDDHAASFTGCNSCVDIFAPGVEIVSTYLEQDTATMSGSSMAAAHVAGAAARYMSMEACAPSPKYVKQWLLKKATKDAIQFSSDQEDCKNSLLFVDCEMPDFQCVRL